MSLKDFILVRKFRGYKNKRDVTKEGPGIAVSGSKNVIIVDGEKIGVRPGTSYFGTKSADRYGIQGGGNWKTNSGEEYPWRSFMGDNDGSIEVYVSGAWETLLESRTFGKFRAVGWWDATEGQELLILVNGEDNLFMWSGGVAALESETANTLTKSGADTWAESRFLTSGTRGVRIKDNTGTWRSFTYTGGENTDTLTGVAPDPTAFTFDDNALVMQDVRVTADSPAADLGNDFLGVYLNYLFVFNEQRRVVNMSKNTDYTDFSAPASPRIPGEADTFNLDDVPTFAIDQPDGDSFYISTKNKWYQITFTPSADLTKEVTTVKPLKSALLEGATNSLAGVNMKNHTFFISGEPTIDLLGSVENVDTPQSQPYSDPVKNDLDVAGVDTAAVTYYKNATYTAYKEESDTPANNRILIRNLANNYWEAPWTIPASLMFEYAGSIYAHSPSTKNTFKLFDSNYEDGRNGNIQGAPIPAKWFSSHEDYGKPFNHKKFNMMWVNGYIRANTTIDVYFIYDFGQETKKFSIIGTDDGVIVSSDGGGLGTNNLGTRSLGGRGETLGESGLRRFNGFFPIPERPFYELQVSFQSEGVGYRWEIVEYGMNIQAIQGQNNNRKFSQT